MGRIVIAAYRPKKGQGEALRRLIVDHVPTLRAEGLVTDRAPITMEAQDGTVVEVFEWKSPAAIEAAHGNAAVQKMWGEYSEVCDYVPMGQVPEAAQLFSDFTPIDAVRHEGPKARARVKGRKPPPAKRRR
jgi:hypothetical protein